MAEGDAAPSVSTVEALEARIRLLEAELSAARRESNREGRRDQPRTERRDFAESTRETADQAVDESSRLLRSMTLAYAEGLRSVADAVGTFSDELTRRNDEGDRERIASLPGDVYASYLKALSQALKIPERSVDRFQETYRREEARDRREDAQDRAGERDAGDRDDEAVDRP